MQGVVALGHRDKRIETILIFLKLKCRSVVVLVRLSNTACVVVFSLHIELLRTLAMRELYYSDAVLPYGVTLLVRDCRAGLGSRCGDAVGGRWAVGDGRWAAGGRRAWWGTSALNIPLCFANLPLFAVPYCT